MNECERFAQQLSALLDGELSGEEEAELRAHMEVCPDCRAMYEAFAAVGAAIREQDVPDTLHDGIMTKVRTAEKAMKTQRTIVRLRPILAAAACLVVLVGTVLALNNTIGFGRRDSKSAKTEAAPAEAPMAPDMNAVYTAGAGAAAASAPTEESEKMIFDAWGETANVPTADAAATNEAAAFPEAPNPAPNAAAADSGGAESSSVFMPNEPQKTDAAEDELAQKDDSGLQMLTIRVESVTQDGFIGSVTDPGDQNLARAGETITILWDGDRDALAAGTLLTVRFDPQQQTDDGGGIRAVGIAPAEN